MHCFSDQRLFARCRLGVEGPRELGMDTRWATWTGPTPISL